ncbi:hypothetical protein C6P86_25790 [Burkholderia multivorans]|nr:hypothetical protein C6P86_25790 [Burkholderia multivorans]PRE86641.1 hypothetical protein C6Q00_12690 [Burkholderia multivorans]PRG22710.1 hypothetical protein C6T57_13760 [Burkholderia multivorans]
MNLAKMEETKPATITAFRDRRRGPPAFAAGGSKASSASGKRPHRAVPAAGVPAAGVPAAGAPAAGAPAAGTPRHRAPPIARP